MRSPHKEMMVIGKVSLNINGRAYGLGCEDGEETRLARLGEKLNARVMQMADQFGQIGDLRLLVMAGITLLDEMEDPNSSAASFETRLSEAKEEAARETEAARADAQAAEEARGKTEVEAVESLLTAAERIERLAERLSERSA